MFSDVKSYYLGHMSLVGKFFVFFFFFFQAEDGIRDGTVTGVQVCSSDLRSIWLHWLSPLHPPCPPVVESPMSRHSPMQPVSPSPSPESPSPSPVSLLVSPSPSPSESMRSEERRVGKECTSRWSADHVEES